LEKKKINIVLEGGGEKGIALVGAIKEIEKIYDWVYLAGSSAGAIVATLLAVNCTADEMLDVMNKIYAGKVFDSTGFGKVPLIGPLWNLISRKGFFEGDVILAVVREMIKQKTNKEFYTFADLKNDHPNLEANRLNLMVTDISNRRLLVLPEDCDKIGTPPDELEIAWAMRMSMSFPLVYVPVIENGTWIMDGGVLSNFPYWYIDRLNTGFEDTYPTIGLLLDERSDLSIKGVWSMIKALVGTMTSPLDQAYDVYSKKNSVLRIAVQGYKTFYLFGLSDAKKQLLIAHGKTAARNFIAYYNYDAAIADLQYVSEEQKLEVDQHLYVDLNEREIERKLLVGIQNFYTAQGPVTASPPSKVFGNAKAIVRRLTTEENVFQDVNDEIERLKREDANWANANLLDAALAQVNALGLYKNTIEENEIFLRLPIPKLDKPDQG